MEQSELESRRCSKVIFNSYRKQGAAVNIL